MKLLFSSSDPGKVEDLKKGLTSAGIACETRNRAGSDDGSGIPFYPELWIRHETDYPIAARVLARLGTG